MARVLSSLPFWQKRSFRKQLATLQRYAGRATTASIMW